MTDEQNQPNHLDDEREGCGLHLRVTPSDDGVAKTFYQTVPLHGKQSVVKVGTYPQVILSEARRRAVDNLKRVRDEEGSTEN